MAATVANVCDFLLLKAFTLISQYHLARLSLSHHTQVTVKQRKRPCSICRHIHLLIKKRPDKVVTELWCLIDGTVYVYRRGPAERWREMKACADVLIWWWLLPWQPNEDVGGGARSREKEKKKAALGKEERNRTENYLSHTSLHLSLSISSAHTHTRTCTHQHAQHTPPLTPLRIYQ